MCHKLSKGQAVRISWSVLCFGRSYGYASFLVKHSDRTRPVYVVLISTFCRSIIKNSHMNALSHAIPHHFKPANHHRRTPAITHQQVSPSPPLPSRLLALPPLHINPSSPRHNHPHPPGTLYQPLPLQPPKKLHKILLLIRKALLQKRRRKHIHLTRRHLPMIRQHIPYEPE